MEVLRHTRARRFGRNEVVFHEGDPGDALHIVESGLFVARSSSTLGHVLTVNVFTPWSVFGELRCSHRTRAEARPLSVRPGSTRLLHRDDLQELRLGSAGRIIDQFLLAVLVERNRALTAQLVELLFTPPRNGSSASCYASANSGSPMTATGGYESARTNWQ